MSVGSGGAAVDRRETSTRRLMALVGGIQGLALWGLRERWPGSAETAAWFVALAFPSQEALQAGRVEVVPPPLWDVEIGGRRMVPTPR